MKIVGKKGENMKSTLEKAGVILSFPCGGLGKCGKCKVRIIEGNLPVYQEEKKLLTEEQLKQGVRLACLHDELSEDCIIDVVDSSMDVLGATSTIVPDVCETGIGVAIDIGTTTVVIQALDLCDGRCVFESKFANPQKQYGADVISRLHTMQELSYSMLHECIVSKIEEEISKIHQHITRMVVSGNTVMTHLFLNEDPMSMAMAPFDVKVKDTVHVSSKSIFKQTNDFDIAVLGNFSAFVGGDILAGAIALDLKNNNKSILLDLGTNGEIILQYENKIYTTSTAAGPAFEGGNMKSGVASIQGAISQINYDGSWHYTTIGNEKPIGICGSGYIDFFAEAIKNNFIDETGFMEEDILVGDCVVCGKDVRQFQLAKSAIRSGFECLLLEASCSIQELNHVYLAGGFAHHTSIDRLMTVGVLPYEVKDKVSIVGNTSLLGAIWYLLKKENNEQWYKERCTTVDLATNKQFAQKYMEYMGFDNEENN